MHHRLRYGTDAGCLVCIGDAIASFLQQPDSCTLDHVSNPASCNLDLPRCSRHPGVLQRKSWFKGVFGGQWYRALVL